MLLSGGLFNILGKFLIRLDHCICEQWCLLIFFIIHFTLAMTYVSCTFYGGSVTEVFLNLCKGVIGRIYEYVNRSFPYVSWKNGVSLSRFYSHLLVICFLCYILLLERSWRELMLWLAIPDVCPKWAQEWRRPDTFCWSGLVTHVGMFQLAC